MAGEMDTARALIRRRDHAGSPEFVEAYLESELDRGDEILWQAGIMTPVPAYDDDIPEGGSVDEHGFLYLPGQMPTPGWLS